VFAGQGLDANAAPDAPTTIVEGMHGKAWSYTNTAVLLPTEPAAITPAPALPGQAVAPAQRSAQSDGETPSTSAGASDGLRHSTEQNAEDGQHAVVDDVDAGDDDEEEDDADEGEQMDATAAFIDELDTDSESD
jgi:hypothetical protein